VRFSGRGSGSPSVKECCVRTTSLAVWILAQGHSPLAILIFIFLLLSRSMCPLKSKAFPGPRGRLVSRKTHVDVSDPRPHNPYVPPPSVHPDSLPPWRSLCRPPPPPTPLPPTLLKCLLFRLSFDTPRFLKRQILPALILAQCPLIDSFDDNVGFREGPRTRFKMPELLLPSQVLPPPIGDLSISLHPFFPQATAQFLRYLPDLPSLVLQHNIV